LPSAREAEGDAYGARTHRAAGRAMTLARAMAMALAVHLDVTSVRMPRAQPTVAGWLLRRAERLRSRVERLRSRVERLAASRAWVSMSQAWVYWPTRRRASA